MSWARHNPEKYDEIVRAGIVHWIDGLMHKAGFAVPGGWLNGYEALVEVLQTEPLVRDIYDDILTHANRDISLAEQEFFSGVIDDHGAGI